MNIPHDCTQTDETEPIWDTEARQVLHVYATDEQLANMGEDENGFYESN